MANRHGAYACSKISVTLVKASNLVEGRAKGGDGRIGVRRFIRCGTYRRQWVAVQRRWRVFFRTALTASHSPGNRAHLRGYAAE
jgi:hypothetical protein